MNNLSMTMFNYKDADTTVLDVWVLKRLYATKPFIRSDSAI